jgi:hypothetical protein
MLRALRDSHGQFVETVRTKAIFDPMLLYLETTSINSYFVEILLCKRIAQILVNAKSSVGVMQDKQKGWGGYYISINITTPMQSTERSHNIEMTTSNQSQ